MLLQIRRVPDCGIVDCIPDNIFEGTLTKQPALYSYFSAPSLNNKLFFANGKRLPLFVNQTIKLWFTITYVNTFLYI